VETKQVFTVILRLNKQQSADQLAPLSSTVLLHINKRRSMRGKIWTLSGALSVVNNFDHCTVLDNMPVIILTDKP